MMLHLIRNVRLQISNMPRTDGKRPISCLPMKACHVGVLGLYPGRRITLQFAHQLRDRRLFSKPAQNVDVVFRAANDQRRRILISADAGEIGMCSLAQVGINQKWLAALRREDDVNVNLRERLAHHRLSIVQPLRGWNWLWEGDPGCAATRRPWALLSNRFAVPPLSQRLVTTSLQTPRRSCRHRASQRRRLRRRRPPLRPGPHRPPTCTALRSSRAMPLRARRSRS